MPPTISEVVHQRLQKRTQSALLVFVACTANGLFVESLIENCDRSWQAILREYSR